MKGRKISNQKFSSMAGQTESRSNSSSAAVASHFIGGDSDDGALGTKMIAQHHSGHGACLARSKQMMMMVQHHSTLGTKPATAAHFFHHST